MISTLFALCLMVNFCYSTEVETTVETELYSESISESISENISENISNTYINEDGCLIADRVTAPPIQDFTVNDPNININTDVENNNDNNIKTSINKVNTVAAPESYIPTVGVPIIDELGLFKILLYFLAAVAGLLIIIGLICLVVRRSKPASVIVYEEA